LRYFPHIPALLLALLALLSTQTPLAVLWHYQDQREWVAEVLCEKREVENNCCQGSCYLEKNTSGQDDATPQPEKVPSAFSMLNASSPLLFFAANPYAQPPLLRQVLLQKWPMPQSVHLHLSGHVRGIFRPPCFA